MWRQSTTVQVTNKIFDMVNAIVTRERTRLAMDLYEDLLTLKEPPMRILFLIARQFNQLLLVKENDGKGNRQGNDRIKAENSALCGRKSIGPGRRVHQRTDFVLRKRLC